jgi:hypothetical protein
MRSVLQAAFRKRVLGAVAAIAVCALALPVHATTLIKKNFDDLVTEADAVVVGTVRDTQAQYAADRRIHTLVTISDLRVLNGRYDGTSLTLQLVGGRIENDVMLVHGSPRFAVNDRVIVFVQGNGTQMVPFVGWTQGVFRVERDARGRQKVFDHERNPVVEIRGSEVVRDQVNAGDAAIVADPAKSGGSAGKDDSGAASPGVGQGAARGREAMDADSFIAAVTRRAREKQAAGKTVQSVAAPAAVASPQDAAPPQR